MDTLEAFGQQAAMNGQLRSHRWQWAQPSSDYGSGSCRSGWGFGLKPRARPIGDGWLRFRRC